MARPINEEEIAYLMYGRNHKTPKEHKIEVLEELSQRIQLNYRKLNIKGVESLIQELIEEIKKS